MLSPGTRSNSAPCGTHPLSEWGDGLSVQSIVLVQANVVARRQSLHVCRTAPFRDDSTRVDFVPGLRSSPWKRFTFREPPAIRCWLGLPKLAMGARKAISPHITKASRSALARHQAVSGAIRMDLRDSFAAFWQAALDEKQLPKARGRVPRLCTVRLEPSISF